MADYPLDQKLWRYMSVLPFHVAFLQKKVTLDWTVGYTERSLGIGNQSDLSGRNSGAWSHHPYRARTPADERTTRGGSLSNSSPDAARAGSTSRDRRCQSSLQRQAGIVVVGEYARWAIYTPSVPVFWDGTDDDLWGLLRATEYDAGDTTPSASSLVTRARAPMLRCQKPEQNCSHRRDASWA